MDDLVLLGPVRGIFTFCLKKSSKRSSIFRGIVYVRYFCFFFSFLHFAGLYQLYQLQNIQKLRPNAKIAKKVGISKEIGFYRNFENFVEKAKDRAKKRVL